VKEHNQFSRRAIMAAPLAGIMLHSSETQAQPSTYRIIDPHVHVWTHDPQFPFAKETRTPPADDATVEMLLELMKKHSVERTVIIQVIHYRWDNSYVASVLKRHSRIFHGVARVDPENPAAPEHLSKLVQEQGFHGVRLSPAGNSAGDWFKGALMPPLWKRCEELKVPMTILAPITRMPDVALLADKHPDLTIVIDHMADCPIDQPDQLEKLLALKRYPKLFVKISHTWSLSRQPFPFRDTWPQVKRVYDAFGPQRLMWATDWPIVNARASYTQALAVVKDEMDFLNADDKSWMLSKTIERVWPFPA
jgi:predicted TIM-barrel fold metal-dependent hydrolase